MSRSQTNYHTKEYLMNNKCKHMNKESDYTICCDRDGSIRKIGKGCPCNCHTPTLLSKIKQYGFSSIFKK